MSRLRRWPFGGLCSQSAAPASATGGNSATVCSFCEHGFVKTGIVVCSLLWAAACCSVTFYNQLKAVFTFNRSSQGLVHSFRRAQKLEIPKWTKKTVVKYVQFSSSQTDLSCLFHCSVLFNLWLTHCWHLLEALNHIIWVNLSKFKSKLNIKAAFSFPTFFIQSLSLSRGQTLWPDDGVGNDYLNAFVIRSQRWTICGWGHCLSPGAQDSAEEAGGGEGRGMKRRKCRRWQSESLLRTYIIHSYSGSDVCRALWKLLYSAFICPQGISAAQPIAAVQRHYLFTQLQNQMPRI